jgi:putative transposase
MKRTKFSEEQVSYAFRHAKSGTPVADVCRPLGVSEAPALERTLGNRQVTQSITGDNCPELMSRDLEDWAHHSGVQLDFPRLGKPADNSSIASRNGKLCEEGLHLQQFLTLKDAQAKLKRWHIDYNEARPHGGAPVGASPD